MTRGSKFFADTAARRREHVKRLKRAGLVIFGRTNTCELGCHSPASRNSTAHAQSLERRAISGGSSGGAAAAVAARMLPLAHAPTGSVRSERPRRAAGWSASSRHEPQHICPFRRRRTRRCFDREHAVSLTVRDSAALWTRRAGPVPAILCGTPAAGPYLRKSARTPADCVSRGPPGPPMAPGSIRNVCAC